MRIDKYLYENSMAKSRTHAHSLIISGFVRCDGRIVMRPSFEVSGSEKIEISGDVCPYVSRGGLKLECALDGFGIDPSGKIAVDIGASTGGFTDVLLRRGAKRVYAFDSGHGQLDAKIASDPRVVSVEGFNARFLTHSDVGESVDIAVCDVSFISQTYIHPGAFDVLSDSGDFIGLIKPQFETEKRFLSKGGVVKEPKVRIDAVKRVLESLSKMGFSVLGLIKSPIKGGDGNTEYLVWASRREGTEISDAQIRRTVCEENSNTSKER